MSTDSCSENELGPSMPIPVLIRNRRNQVHLAYGVNQSHLLSVPQRLQSVQRTPIIFTKLYIPNIRSLADKSFFVNDIVISYNLDFLFLTEMWLAKGSSATVLNEKSSSKFQFYEYMPNWQERRRSSCFI